MNGRVYSPSLGRMLSPDPVTQAPENGQNYNRYTYAFNNPLKYTDPSGYQVSELTDSTLEGSGANWFGGASSSTSNSDLHALDQLFYLNFFHDIETRFEQGTAGLTDDPIRMAKVIEIIGCVEADCTFAKKILRTQAGDKLSHDNTVKKDLLILY